MNKHAANKKIINGGQASTKDRRISSISFLPPSNAAVYKILQQTFQIVDTIYFLQVTDIFNRYAVEVFKVGKNIVYKHDNSDFIRAAKVCF